MPNLPTIIYRPLHRTSQSDQFYPACINDPEAVADTFNFAVRLKEKKENQVAVTVLN